MRLQTLTINSYKSFYRPTIIELSNSFNAFIGPNNSGKTNILDAVDFLSHPDKDPDRLHHHRAQLELVIDVKGDADFKGMDRISLRGDQYTVTARSDSGKALPDALKKRVFSKIKRLQYQDFNDITEIENYYTSLAKDYPDVFKKLTSLLTQYFPEIDSIERIVDAESGSSVRIIEGEHTSITIERLGSGFRRVLVILLYALHPAYSVVLIDEPEIHLHPAMIKKVRKVLSATNANQVLITSHSPLFIAAHTLHQVYRVLKDEKGSHVYYLKKSKKRVDRKRLVQELTSDTLEMFFADQVLLVEGVSDRILMRALIDRFYTGNKEIKVIYVHGKTNIDIYMDLMEVFHIPFLVMLDRDAMVMAAHEVGISVPKRRRRKGASRGIIDQLKRRHIYIIEKGSIEHVYPRKYQRRDTKPLNALFAAANITKEEYQSTLMRPIREVIDSLIR